MKESGPEKKRSNPLKSLLFAGGLAIAPLAANAQEDRSLADPSYPGEAPFAADRGGSMEGLAKESIARACLKLMQKDPVFTDACRGLLHDIPRFFELKETHEIPWPPLALREIKGLYGRMMYNLAEIKRLIDERPDNFSEDEMKEISDFLSDTKIVLGIEGMVLQHLEKPLKLLPDQQ